MSQASAAGAEDEWLLGAMEAVLMVVAEPLPAAALATAVERPQEQVEEALSALQEEYLNSGRPRGMELREVGGGWRFYSAAEFSPVVEGFVDRKSTRLNSSHVSMSYAGLCLKK